MGSGEYGRGYEWLVRGLLLALPATSGISGRSMKPIHVTRWKSALDSMKIILNEYGLVSQKARLSQKNLVRPSAFTAFMALDACRTRNGTATPIKMLSLLLIGSFSFSKKVSDIRGVETSPCGIGIWKPAACSGSVRHRI
jgi:hypothetical protein